MHQPKSEATACAYWRSTAFRRSRPGTLDSLHLTKRRADRIQARDEALVEQLFLVRDVVVDGRFGDIERAGDVVQRSVVEAVLGEGAGGDPHDGVALHTVVPQTLATLAPGGGGVGAVGSAEGLVLPGRALGTGIACSASSWWRGC